jgi:5-(aminomethyl)-3-furanmethanol phosphate kinase
MGSARERRGVCARPARAGRAIRELFPRRPSAVVKPVVIKVGGSLLGWPEFPDRLRAYLDDNPREKPVLVVGGGGAADLVRDLDRLHAIGEKRSHGLALRALDLTAHVVAALVGGLVVVERLEALEMVWRQGRIPVLAPRWFLENVDQMADDPLGETWEVTTDSIAACVAGALQADELQLLKSAGLEGISSRIGAARAGYVDPMFPAASKAIARVAVVNLRANPPTCEPLDP